MNKIEKLFKMQIIYIKKKIKNYKKHALDEKLTSQEHVKYNAVVYDNECLLSLLEWNYIDLIDILKTEETKE